MNTKGFIKRILPFVGAFSLGLFIASFFVSIGLPRMGNGHRGMRGEYKRQFRMEMERLRQENFELKNQLRELQSDRSATGPSSDLKRVEAMPLIDVPPPPPLPPMPPAAPHAHR